MAVYEDSLVVTYVDEVKAGTKMIFSFSWTGMAEGGPNNAGKAVRLIFEGRGPFEGTGGTTSLNDQIHRDKVAFFIYDIPSHIKDSVDTVWHARFEDADGNEVYSQDVPISLRVSEADDLPEIPFEIKIGPNNAKIHYGETAIITAEPIDIGVPKPYKVTWTWKYNGYHWVHRDNMPYEADFVGWGDKLLVCIMTIEKEGYKPTKRERGVYVFGESDLAIYFPQKRTYGSDTGIFTVKDDPSFFTTCAVKGWLPPKSSAKYKYTLHKLDGTPIADLGTTAWVELDLSLPVGLYKIKVEMTLTMPGYFGGLPQVYTEEINWYNLERTSTTPNIDFDIAPLTGTNYLYNADKRRDFDVNIRGANITVATQASSEIWNDFTQAWSPRPAAVNVAPTPAKVRYQMYTPENEWGRMDYGEQYIYILVEYTLSTTTADRFVQIVKRVKGDFGKLLDGSWTYSISQDQTVPMGQYVSLSTGFEIPGYGRPRNELSSLSYWTNTNGDYVTHQRYLIAPTNVAGKFTYYTQATYFLYWEDLPDKRYARLVLPLQWTNLTVLENVQTATVSTKVVTEGTSILPNPKQIVIAPGSGYYDKLIVTPSDSKAVLSNIKWTVTGRDGVPHVLGTGVDFYNANLADFLKSKTTNSTGLMGELVVTADLVEPGKITGHPAIRTNLYIDNTKSDTFLTNMYIDGNPNESVRNVPVDAKLVLLDSYQDKALNIQGPRYYDYLKPDLSVFAPAETTNEPAPHITKLDTSKEGTYPFIISYLSSNTNKVFAATREIQYIVGGFGPLSLEITPPTTIKLNDSANVTVTLKNEHPLPYGTELKYAFKVDDGEFVTQASKTFAVTPAMTATEKTYKIIGRVTVSCYGYPTSVLTAETQVEVKFIPEVFPDFGIEFMPPTKVKAPGDDAVLNTELTGVDVSVPGLEITYTWNPNDSMWQSKADNAVFYWTDKYSAEGPKTLSVDVTLTAPGYEMKKINFPYNYVISKGRAPVTITLTTYPDSINIKSGEVATVEATIDGLDAFPGTAPDVITYAWYRNGILVPTETTNVYNVDSRIVSETIPVYCVASVENTNFEPFRLRSNDCLVTITPPDGWPADFEVELTPNDVYAKLGDPDIVLTTAVNMIDYDSIVYSWVKNGVVIPGESTPTLTVKADKFIEQDHYQVRVNVKKAGLSDLLAYDSAFIHVGVIKGYKPVIVPMNEVVYEGEKIIFGVLNENLPEEATVVYSWYLNSVQEMSGTNPFVRERLVGVPDNVQIPVYCSVYVELEGYESRTYQTETATLSQRSGPTPGGVSITPANGVFVLNSVATLKAELNGVPANRPVSYIWSVDGSAQQASDSDTFVLNTSSTGIKAIQVTASLTTAGIPDGEFTAQTFATVFEPSENEDDISVHPLPRTGAAFVWLPWWIVDEIQKGKEEGYDWKVDYAQLNYSGFLKSLSLALGQYPNLEMQESRHGYIFNKEQLELGYTAGSGLPFIYLK